MKAGRPTLAASIALFATACVALGASTKAKTPAPPPVGTNFVLNGVITNNPPPVVAVIIGTPQFEDFGSNSPYGEVYTDGSGKIDGVEDMIFTNLDLCDFTSGDFIAQIGGSITTVGSGKKNAANRVLVQMTMKGDGYVQDALGTSQAQANLNLSFKGQLFATNSLVNLTTTNTFLYIGTNNGAPFTHLYTYSPATNVYTTNTVSYQTLQIYYTVQTSTTSTDSSNGTNTVLIQNSLCQDICPVTFGTPIGTTDFNTFTNCYSTDVFTNVLLGTNIEYGVTGTNFTPIYGLDVSDLANYIAAVTNSITTNGAGYARSVVAIVTNTVTGGSGGSTNISLYAELTNPSFNGTNWTFGTTNPVILSFSNGFFEVDGMMNGQITAGKCKQSFKGTNASFSLPFTNYTTMIGSGSNTAGPYFGTNNPYLGPNDSGIYYVIFEQVPGSGLTNATAFGRSLYAMVKQFGNNIWISSQGGFIGSGSQNPKKNDYKVNLSGVGRLRGSSLVITGAIGTNIVGYVVETNILAFTNIAANPPVVGFVTNTSAHPYGNSFYVPSQIIAGQAIGDSFYDDFTLTTNGAGTAEITITNNTVCSSLYIPSVVVTNTVKCIRTLFANGKALGQKVSGSGTNADIAYPNPALPSLPTD